MDRPTILVVEDEPAIADTIQYALESEGFRCLRLEVGTGVTEVLDQGFYEIGIDCRRTSDATSGTTVRNVELAVVGIGVEGASTMAGGADIIAFASSQGLFAGA